MWTSSPHPTDEGSASSGERSDIVEAVLRDTRVHVAEAAAGYLPETEPRRWLYDLMASYPSRPGKGIRSALCLSVCRAFGGSSEEALPTAVAIELLHNAFLIHDDVEDGSERRRGRPTLHAEHGLPLAINAGDGLAVLALRPLRENPGLLGGRLTEMVAHEIDELLRRTVEGQAIELGWRADNVIAVTPRDYLEMIYLKTCMYTTIAPLRLGAMIGSWGAADLTAVTRFGFYLGAAFQIRDDVLNLQAAEVEYGKEILGDLFEGKRTLMLIHLLSVASAATRDWVRNLLSTPRDLRTERDVRHLMGLMQEHGSLSFARHFSEGVAQAAYEAFDEAFAAIPESDDVRFVQALIPYMLERKL